MSIRISILMPCYNAAKYIEVALKSIPVSDAVEICVQDGGSTDGTTELLASLRETLPNLSFVSEADGGQADALNRALGRARGHYVGWLNADDVYVEPAISTVVDALATETSDVVYGDFQVVDARGAPLRTYQSGQWNARRFFTHGCYIFSGATFWDREFLQGVGGFDANLHYSMDLELFLRAGQSARARKIDGTVAALRIHPESKTGAQGFKFASEAYEVRKRYAVSTRDVFLARKIAAQTVATVALQPVRFSRPYSALRRRKTL